MLDLFIAGYVQFVITETELEKLLSQEIVFV